MNGRLTRSGRGGQFNLGFFRRFLQTLQGQLVFAEINRPGPFLNSIGEIIDDRVSKVFAAQGRVAIGGFHFEHAVADFQDRHVERAAAKVIDHDGAAVFLVEAIGQGSSRWLVDDAQHFKARDLAGVFGCLALGVIEIGRNRDDGFGNGFAEDRIRPFPSSSARCMRKLGWARASCRGTRPTRRHCHL